MNMRRMSPGSIIARQTLTPLDLERTYGLTEGNIFHGDLSLEQLFFMRPVPGWSRVSNADRRDSIFVARAHTRAAALPERRATMRRTRPWRLEERSLQGRLRRDDQWTVSGTDIVIVGTGVMGASIAFPSRPAQEPGAF